MQERFRHARTYSSRVVNSYVFSPEMAVGKSFRKMCKTQDCFARRHASIASAFHAPKTKPSSQDKFIILLLP